MYRIPQICSPSGWCNGNAARKSLRAQTPRWSPRGTCQGKERKLKIKPPSSWVILVFLKFNLMLIYFAICTFSARTFCLFNMEYEYLNMSLSVVIQIYITYLLESWMCEFLSYKDDTVGTAIKLAFQYIIRTMIKTLALIFALSNISYCSDFYTQWVF